MAPRLSRAGELKTGFRIQRGLVRLAALLPWHPASYRRIIERLAGALENQEMVYPWLSRRTTLRRDHGRALKALARAEEEAPGEPAWKRLESGVRILRRYPLEPEVASRFARELAAGGRLDATPRAERLATLIRRVARRLEEDKNLLVLANVRLVLKEVLRRRPRGIEPADLYQEGVVGLHRAAFRFDASRGLRFSTYATYWIRQGIRKSLSEKSRVIRVPQGIQEDALKKVATATGGTEEARRIKTLLSAPMPLEVRFEAGPPRDPEFHTAGVPGAVQLALERLSPKEKLVIERRFGIGNGSRERLEDIGARLRLSRERIRQIELAALKRLGRFRGLKEVYEDLAAVEPENGRTRPVT
jgi:RNA polymerase sigma factor (sigma-70 family)